MVSQITLAFTTPGIIADAILGVLAAFGMTLGLYVFSRYSKARQTTDTRITDLEAKFTGSISSAVQSMSTALVKQDEEWQTQMRRLAEDIARRHDRMEDALEQAVRALAVLTNRMARQDDDLAKVLRDTAGLVTSTAVLKERLDRHEKWAETHSPNAR